MQFSYKAQSKNNEIHEGVIDADNINQAREILQRRGLEVQKISRKTELKLSFDSLKFFKRVSTKDVVILSQQISTLFSAQVSTLRIFSLLAQESDNEQLRVALQQVTRDLEAGLPISQALAAHPKIFSDFYVNMVASGEETGKLSESFMYLSEYLERNYELTSKARNAFIYPGFVLSTFFIVMILMFVYIIPKIGVILVESGQELPVYTQIVLGISDFLVGYGLIILAAVILGVIGLVYYYRNSDLDEKINHFLLHVPYLGNLYRKLYLSRFSDNMNTMLTSGIPMVKAIETTASVIGNTTYEAIMIDAATKVRSGVPLSDALQAYPEYIPSILSQMVQVGEETGKIGEVLEVLSRFYKREVNSAVDSLVSLIEPAMIILLAIGVGTLLASVLIPIYNISSGI